MGTSRVLRRVRDLLDVNWASVADGEVLTYDQASDKIVGAAGGGGGVTDHGALTGLADDDHAQYHTDARGDARYSQLGHAHAGEEITSGTVADARIAATIARDAEVTSAASAAQAAAEATAASALASHAADGTAVHGITDTAALETTSGAQAKVDAHVNDGVDAHDASAISFAPAGSIAATDVQAAIEEVASEAVAPGQLFLSAAGMWPSLTAGCAEAAKTEAPTNDVNLYTLDFDSSSQENAECTVAMPSDWDGGTVTAVFYWTAGGTSTNSVVWACQARSYGDEETIDQAFGTEQVIADAHTATALQVQISDATPAITIAGAGASELVQFKVKRNVADGSDTLAVDAMLIGVMIAYTRS